MPLLLWATNLPPRTIDHTTSVIGEPKYCALTMAKSTKVDSDWLPQPHVKLVVSRGATYCYLVWHKKPICTPWGWRNADGAAWKLLIYSTLGCMRHADLWQFGVIVEVSKVTGVLLRPHEEAAIIASLPCADRGSATSAVWLPPDKCQRHSPQLHLHFIQHLQPHFVFSLHHQWHTRSFVSPPPSLLYWLTWSTHLPCHITMPQHIYLCNKRYGLRQNIIMAGVQLLNPYKKLKVQFSLQILIQWVWLNLKYTTWYFFDRD